MAKAIHQAASASSSPEMATQEQVDRLARSTPVQLTADLHSSIVEGVPLCRKPAEPCRHAAVHLLDRHQLAQLLERQAKIVDYTPDVVFMDGALSCSRTGVVQGFSCCLSAHVDSALAQQQKVPIWP
jgi:hypothetical protein